MKDRIINARRVEFLAPRMLGTECVKLDLHSTPADETQFQDV